LSPGKGGEKEMSFREGVSHSNRDIHDAQQTRRPPEKEKGKKLGMTPCTDEDKGENPLGASLTRERKGRKGVSKGMDDPP